MREKPPIGEMRFPDMFNATAVEIAAWVFNLVGPYGARQISDALLKLADNPPEEYGQ